MHLFFDLIVSATDVVNGVAADIKVDDNVTLVNYYSFCIEKPMRRR